MLPFWQNLFTDNAKAYYLFFNQPDKKDKKKKSVNGSPFMSIRYCNRLTVKLGVRLRMYTMGNFDSYLNLHRNYSFAKELWLDWLSNSGSELINLL